MMTTEIAVAMKASVVVVVLSNSASRDIVVVIIRTQFKIGIGHNAK